MGLALVALRPTMEGGAKCLNPIGVRTETYQPRGKSPPGPDRYFGFKSSKSLFSSPSTPTLGALSL